MPFSVIVMKTITIFILFLLIGGSTVFALRAWQVRQLEHDKFIPISGPTRIINPPSGALTGKILQIKGLVNIHRRRDNDFTRLDSVYDIVQGEELQTKDSGQAVVEFQNFATLKLFKQSEIALVSLLPKSFLVKQRSGQVNYQLSSDKNSLSVRILHTLFTLKTGSASITLDQETGNIVIELVLGEGNFALPDLEDNTQVWTLVKGQKAVIDDEKRTVQIQKISGHL